MYLAASRRQSTPRLYALRPSALFGWQETLANMIVGARALEILGAAFRVPVGNKFAAAIFDRVRALSAHSRNEASSSPGAFLEAQSDAVDFADFCPAPRRRVQADQQPVRPTIVFGK